MVVGEKALVSVRGERMRDLVTVLCSWAKNVCSFSRSSSSEELPFEADTTLMEFGESRA